MSQSVKTPLVTMTQRDKLINLDCDAIGMLEIVKRKLGPLTQMLPSSTLRDKARKAYDICKEIQDDLSQ